MSKALDIADRMQARLAALSTLSGVTCVVDRQKNIAAEIAGAIGKGKAACISILYDGFSNPDASQGGGRPTVIRRYTATVYAVPILTGAAKYADDVLELAATALHNWEPVEATDFFSEINVRGADFRPDLDFLIYELHLEATSKL